MNNSNLSYGNNNSSKIDNIQKIAPLFGAIITVYLAISYFCARIFYASYCESMNIRFELMELSWLDFIEIGWVISLMLMILIIAVIVIPIFFALQVRRLIYSKNKLIKILGLIIFLLISLFFLPIYEPYTFLSSPNNYQLSSAVKQHIVMFSVIEFIIFAIMVVYRNFNILKINTYIRNNVYAMIAFCIFSLSIMLIIAFISNFSQDLGVSFGRQQVIENNQLIVLVSKQPLQILGVQPVVNEVAGQNTFTYQGLRLLTNNNGKYFLFRNIDTNCKPSEVFIIQEIDVQLSFISAPPLAPTCAPATK